MRVDQVRTSPVASRHRGSVEAIARHGPKIEDDVVEEHGNGDVESMPLAGASRATRTRETPISASTFVFLRDALLVASFWLRLEGRGQNDSSDSRTQTAR